MKNSARFLIVLLFGVLAVSEAIAQEAKADVYLGYAYTRFNSATFVPAFSANGGIAQLQFHITPVLGVIADFGEHTMEISITCKSIRRRSPICLVRG